MATYYYEIADKQVGGMGGKYFYSNSFPSSVNYGLHQHYSDRIWVDEGAIEGIRFYKSVKTWRDPSENLSEDDLAEFIWIKLSSKLVV